MRRAGGTQLLRLNYSYSNSTTGDNGNVLNQTITVPTIGSATGFVATQDYTYDQLNRLATVEEKQYGLTTPEWRQQFDYDRYGNRSMGTGSTQTYGRNSTETQALIGPDPTVSTSTNRITNRTGELYEFDASGNMTKDALGNRSVYDIENHQTEYYYAANTGGTPDAKYYYDGDGKRIKKVVGTETTLFVYDASGKLAAEYTLGVTANPSPQTNYITTDTLSSNRLVSNGAGQVVARHDYLPFGDEIYGLGGRTSAQGFAQPDATRQRFTGYEHDGETGLDFAQARYYGNGLGRFTSVDPIMSSAEQAVPQSWNRYAYALNNSIRFVDRKGEKPQESTDDKYEMFPSLKMIPFFIRHPEIALSIGTGGERHSISAAAIRFSTRLGWADGRGSQGTQVNAMRHVVWQSIITARHGAAIAERAGNIHEANPTMDGIVRDFSGRGALNNADTLADLLNNRIGRDLGAKHTTASNKELAIHTLNYFHENGLFGVRANKDGSFSVTTITLSDTEFEKALAAINQLTNWGETRLEEETRDAEFRRNEQDRRRETIRRMDRHP